MEELRRLLEELLDARLLGIVLSAPRQKESYRRIRIRALDCRGALRFQAAFWDGKKEFHKNYEKEALIPELLVWMSHDYRQLQADMTHNRTKQYLLPEGEPVPFLVKLGVMTPEGKVVKAKYDKFRQINRFLEFIEDITPVLAKDREITMIDFGCGKSYLTFAMYYYLHERKGYDLRITGLDLKEDVIAHCNRLAKEFGYEKLNFLTGDIADYEGVTQVDLVVTLHACDTATDYALAKAVAWNARAILSVPCCQHELNRQIKNEVLQPVLRYGLLRERMAALITDGLRASMLEEQGYRVQVLEFIDMEHTPKNILLRAIKEPEKIRRGDAAGKQEELERCMASLHVTPTLEKLLRGACRKG